MATRNATTGARPASGRDSARADSPQRQTKNSRYVRPPGGWWWAAFLGVPLILALVSSGSFAVAFHSPDTVMSASPMPTPAPSPDAASVSVPPTPVTPDADCASLETRVAQVAGKSQVRFAYKASKLTKKAKAAVAAAASLLKECPTVPVLVNGYADRSGPATVNMLISKDRANAVRKRLRSLGVKNPIAVKGLGDRHPIARNSSAKGRAANRRVVIQIP
jgi:outer membrane protein OmpA-like peptidoglycan-associated protein